MNFDYDARTLELRERLVAFMQDRVMPAEHALHAELASEPERWGAGKLLSELKADARAAGLWNLFLTTPHLQDGLTNLQYAPLAEVMGWSPHVAPEVFNCSAPDTGNMELLSHFGTPDQRERWLAPLMAGEIRSCFAMTEPDVASSDANNIRTRIELDGDEWVITGRKWWTTGALRHECKVAMVMGVSDPTADQAHQQSVVLVPLDTAGLTVERSTSVLGFDDRHEGGHGELIFDEVRVPRDHLLGSRGEGFAVAQVRLNPGRIHHCMRLIGMMERAVALMVERAKDRVAFGIPLIEQGVVQQWIADSRIDIEAARLLVLRAAASMDQGDQKSAREEISMAKVFVPSAAERTIDRAIQVHGAKGLSQDTPLAMLYSQARFLRIADGPDEVHRRTLARLEGRKAALLSA
jgi:acyl-CoA dehydrogenase